MIEPPNCLVDIGFVSKKVDISITALTFDKGSVAIRFSQGFLGESLLAMPDFESI